MEIIEILLKLLLSSLLINQIQNRYHPLLCLQAANNRRELLERFRSHENRPPINWMVLLGEGINRGKLEGLTLKLATLVEMEGSTKMVMLRCPSWKLRMKRSKASLCRKSSCLRVYKRDWRIWGLCLEARQGFTRFLRWCQQKVEEANLFWWLLKMPRGIWLLSCDFPGNLHDWKNQANMLANSRTILQVNWREFRDCWQWR